MISSTKSFQHKYSRQIDTSRTALLSQLHKQLDHLDYNQPFLQEKDYKAFLEQSRLRGQSASTLLL